MLRLLAFVAIFLITSAIEAIDDRCELNCEGDHGNGQSCLNEDDVDEVALIQGLVKRDLVLETAKTSPDKPTKTSALSQESQATPMVEAVSKPLVQGTKVKSNAKGDLAAFLGAMKLNGALIILCIVGFMCLRNRYPTVYFYRNIDPDTGYWTKPDYWRKNPAWKGVYPRGWDSSDPAEQTVGQWASLTKTVNIDQVQNSCGLDQAMLLQFTLYAMQIMVIIAVPALLMCMPIYAYAGGGFAHDDKLSWLGVGNVIYVAPSFQGEETSSTSQDHQNQLSQVQWIWWVVAVMVWFVVVSVQFYTFVWQREFQARRAAWLKETPEPCSTTLLVEGIPQNYCTDADLKKFFQDAYGQSAVKDAFVVKNLYGHNEAAAAIPGLIQKYAYADQALAELEFAIRKKTSANELADVSVYEKAIYEKSKEMKDTLTSIRNHQASAVSDANYKGAESSGTENAKKQKEQGEALYTTNGFVTFTERKYCEMAASVQLSVDADEWVVSVAPEDVLYEDLMITPARQKIEAFIGYALLATLFFVYMPCVLVCSKVARWFADLPALHSLIVKSGFKSTLDGVLASFGITVMTCMLPTFLMWIFDGFFVLKSSGLRQLVLQEWYFWYLVIFVLLISAVGTHLTGTLNTLAHSPFDSVSLLARQLPITTHFFMNFVMMQPVTHAMNLTRYVNLFKFVALKKIVDEGRARELSEPEDQDYYGIGSRSARFTIILIIGIVFGTICPLINLLVAFNFLICRTVYGYLIPYAECRKHDSGGYHWARQLHHVQFGVLMYIFMMIGVLYQRAVSPWPSRFCSVSLLWWFISYRKFNRQLCWEKIAFVETLKPTTVSRDAAPKRYFQKELDPDPDVWYPEGRETHKKV